MNKHASHKLLMVLAGVVVLLIVFTRPISAASHRRALSDVNRDGTISKIDMKLVASNFGLKTPTGAKALLDVNQDGAITPADLFLVAKNYGKTISACETADINNDGMVNLTDINIIGQYYGQVDNSTNMAADLNGDGVIDILDLTKAGGLFNCIWSR